MNAVVNLLFLIPLLLLTGCVTEQTSNADISQTTASARAHTELGAAYFQQNNLEIALDEFNQAVKIEPTYALAYNGLGLVYAALQEDAKAEANYKKAVELQPKNSESRNNYGSFLCAKGRYDESITQFLEAVKNPLYATPHMAYSNAGICSARKKDIAQAEVYLNKALQIDPLMHSPAFELAKIQFNRKEIQAAQQTLQNSLITNPGPNILWLGIQIERILGNKDNEASYALQLRQRYPNSQETKLLLSGK